MNKLLKYLLLGSVGGCLYLTIELLWRGYSHWSMFVLAFMAFILIGSINEILPWNMPLPAQLLIGAVIITALEFFTGCIVNLWLGWAVWDYSKEPFNLMGQICLKFFVVWYFLSLVGIVLDDWLRFWWFGEEKPRYRMVKRKLE